MDMLPGFRCGKSSPALVLGGGVGAEPAVGMVPRYGHIHVARAACPRWGWDLHVQLKKPGDDKT